MMLELKGESAENPEEPAARSDDVAPQKRKPLRCRDCGVVVTYDDARIAVAGEHEHMRVNPAAFVYRFGCFKDAEGCAVSGDPTEAHTWFEGCRWQYAHCRGCRSHLGWFFTGAEAFFGLLLDRVVPES